jgi:ABC-type uncharacterized transport system permease subunit
MAGLVLRGVEGLAVLSNRIPCAGLSGALTVLAHQARWTSATPQEWVAYAGLNGIGLGVILHVAIGRRWPFALVPAAVR